MCEIKFCDTARNIDSCDSHYVLPQFCSYKFKFPTLKIWIAKCWRFTALNPLKYRGVLKSLRLFWNNILSHRHLHCKLLGWFSHAFMNFTFCIELRGIFYHNRAMLRKSIFMQLMWPKSCCKKYQFSSLYGRELREDFDLVEYQSKGK